MFEQLTTFGQNKELFSQILDDARSLAMESHSGKTIMYTVIGVDWRQFGHPRQRRPLNSVVLDDGVSEKLTEDVKEFIQVHSNQFKLEFLFWKKYERPDANRI